MIEPFTPQNQPGAHRVDDRRIVSGVVPILRTGCRWRDGPAEYGPPTTVCHRFNRRSRRSFWRAMLATPTERGCIAETASLDSTYVRAHRSAHGGTGGPRRRRSAPRAVVRPPGSPFSPASSAAPRSSIGRPAMRATSRQRPTCLPPRPAACDASWQIGAYDADAPRRDLRAKGTQPIIPGRRCRKHPIRHDKRRSRDRWRIDAAIGRLQNFRRICTRHDKLAANFASTIAIAIAAIAIAAIAASWC